MENLFSTITNKLPKPELDDKDKELLNPDPKKEKLETIVARWQQKETPEDTAKILASLKPTIDSAIHSYAPDSGTTLNIKAAKLALDAMRKFDAKAGTAPSTYAFHNLKRLSRLSASSLNIMEPSETARVQQSALKAAAERFMDKYDREPSIQELSDLTGLPKKRIDVLNGINTVLSESSTLTTDTGRDTWKNSGLSDTDYLEYVYSGSSPIDQKIIEWSSGLHSKKTRSNNDIAKALKISAAAVSQRKQNIQKQIAELRGLL